MCQNSYFEHMDNEEVKNSILVALVVSVTLDATFVEQTQKEREYRSIIAKGQDILVKCCKLKSYSSF